MEGKSNEIFYYNTKNDIPIDKRIKKNIRFTKSWESVPKKLLCQFLIKKYFFMTVVRIPKAILLRLSHEIEDFLPCWTIIMGEP